MSGTIIKPIKKSKTEFDILTSSSSFELKEMVNKRIDDGWEVVGGLNVVIVHSQNRFRGTQHIDTLNKVEYSISMIKIGS